MKFLIIDHLFAQDIDALRQAPGGHEFKIVDYSVLSRLAHKILPPPVFFGLEEYNRPEYFRARQAFAVKAAKRLTKIYRTFPFDAVISPSDTIFYLRPWVAAAREMGVPFIVLQKETTISPFTMDAHAQETGRTFPFISDLMLVCSDRHKQFWLNAGAPADKIIVTGQPRFDLYLQPGKWLTWRQLGLRLLPGRQTILFFHYDLAAYSPVDETAQTPVWEELRASTEATLVDLARTGSYNILIKPHPRQPIQEDRQRLRALAGDLWGREVQMAPLLADTRHLIVNADIIVGFQTTALFESMITGKKVIYTFWSEPVEKYASTLIPFHEMAGALEVARSAPELRALITAPADTGDESRESQRRQIFDEQLGPLDGRTASRCLEIIGAFVAGRRQERPPLGVPDHARPARRVLCYAPYNYHLPHGLWEITVLQALRQRGAQVRAILCDGLYPDCDLFTAAVAPRHARSCLHCQARVTDLYHRLGMPYEWLGRYLVPEDLRAARQWAAGLAPGELPQAAYEGHPLGEWVESSIHSYFRNSRLELADPEVERVYRNFLAGGAVAVTGLTRLLDDFAPEILFLFNGRLSSTRIALELARRRGVRVVCHERGLLQESLMLFENSNCLALAPIKKLWQDWGHIPLTHQQLEIISGYMRARQQGRNLSWRAFSPPPQDADQVRRNLHLSPDRPLWVLFTSSDDEVIAEQDWRGPFSRQLDWIRATVAYAARHPEIDLVIRTHPNTAGKMAVGDNLRQVEELLELQRQLPVNARLVMPEDPVSSYTLMDLAAVGLVYQSTTGLEMACRGKRVVVASGCYFSDLPFVETVKDAAVYPGLLDSLRELPAPVSSREIQRGAYRFAYALFYRYNIGFPLVRMSDPFTGRLAYTCLGDLAPGVEPAIDRVCRIILDREPVCPPPTARDELALDTEEQNWTEPGSREPGSPRDWQARWAHLKQRWAVNRLLLGSYGCARLSLKLKGLSWSRPADWLWIGSYPRDTGDEQKLLQTLEQGAARSGEWLAAPQLVPALERARGKELPFWYGYFLLGRRLWRKLFPR